MHGAFDMRIAASLLFGPLLTPELASIPLGLVEVQLRCHRGEIAQLGRL